MNNKEIKSNPKDQKHDSPMVEVVGVSKKYGNFTAVKNISFSLKKGEILGFLGPNGAGKSTTMNIITGCLSATSGSVSIGGYDILKQPEKAKKCIGYLPETPPLYSNMTVKEYLKFVCNLKGIKDKASQIARCCALCHIGSYENALISQLSKGYRQRVGIAQALLGEPSVLILDEPTSGLDPAQIVETRKLIRSLAQKYTVILSTHILSEIQAVCSRIIIIGGGNIIADDTEYNLTHKDGNSGYLVRVCAEKEKCLEALFELKNSISISVLDSQEKDTTELLIKPNKDFDPRKKIFRCFAKSNLPIIHMSDNNLKLENVFLKLIENNIPIEPKIEKLDNSHPELDKEFLDKIAPEAKVLNDPYKNKKNSSNKKEDK